ncbi:MAG: Ycf48-like protein [Ignavibacteriaceae bacterium]|nr:Ycf48-like protein [Ignavibacteriaceae bacterium]
MSARIMRLVIITLFFQLTALPQWTAQNIGTTSELRSVYFISNFGYIVGAGSAAYRSTDYGVTWTSLNLTQSTTWYGVQFINEEIGWIVGRSGTIVKTTDRGATWTQKTSGTTRNLYSVFFVNSNVGWSVGAGIILKTNDGGETWAVQPNWTGNNPLYGVFFLSELEGWVAGWSQKIMKTTDGGESWTNIPVNLSNMWFQSVYFVSKDTGFVVGGNSDSGTVFKTYDAGNTWTILRPESARWLNSVKFVSKSTGWMVGSYGSLYKTTDCGNTWIRQVLPAGSDGNVFYGMFLKPDQLGCIVGANGQVLYSSPAGMPVELISFNAKVANNAITLNWSTATELNNRVFEIQRSNSEEENWLTIGFAKGKGTITATTYYSFSDTPEGSGKYFYRLKQIDFDGSESFSHTVSVDFENDLNFELFQNFPNPFNPVTTIEYKLNERGRAEIKLFDVLGYEVAVLLNEIKEAGTYKLVLNCDDYKLSSGIFLYQLKYNDKTLQRKLIVLR